MDNFCLSKKVTYTYCNKDLISNPTKYQYTSFEGPSFLISYRNNREDFLKKIKKKISACLESMDLPYIEKDKANHKLAKFIIAHITEDLHEEEIHLWVNLLSVELMPADYRSRFFFNKDLSGSIVTREYLISELQDFSRDKWQLQKRAVSAFNLVQRFEVSKKIFTRYKVSEMKKIDRDFSDFFNFALFHFMLILAAKKSPPKTSLIFQNSMLKVGDIIISCLHRFVTPGQMILGYTSTCKELKLMREIYKV